MVEVPMRVWRWRARLAALPRYVLAVMAGTGVGLALELLIQLYGAAVTPDALQGFPAWYPLGKAVLFEVARIAPAVCAGALAPRRAGAVGAITAVVEVLAVDLAFHGAMPGRVSELDSPLSLAASAVILGFVAGIAGAQLLQRWRARRTTQAV